MPQKLGKKNAKCFKVSSDEIISAVIKLKFQPSKKFCARYCKYSHASGTRLLTILTEARSEFSQNLSAPPVSLHQGSHMLTLESISNSRAFGKKRMAGLSNMSSNEKGELMEQVKQQMAVANVQELLTKMTEKCFKKCITRPGTALDSTEQKCISMCMDRFMDSWNLVSRTYGNRLKREQNKM